MQTRNIENGIRIAAAGLDRRHGFQGIEIECGNGVGVAVGDEAELEVLHECKAMHAVGIRDVGDLLAAIGIEHLDMRGAADEQMMAHRVEAEIIPFVGAGYGVFFGLDELWILGCWGRQRGVAQSIQRQSCQ